MTAAPTPQPEWIKFAGSDVYHRTLVPARAFGNLEQVRCGRLGAVAVRWTAISPTLNDLLTGKAQFPENECPDCTELGISGFKGGEPCK